MTHDEIEKMLGEITPGKWEEIYPTYHADDSLKIFIDYVVATEKDLEFIASAPQIVRQLLDENRRLREALTAIANNIGVPQPEYPGPIAYAYTLAMEALGIKKQP